MKTNSKKTNKKNWLSAAIGLALMILAASPSTVLAQQWTTNGNHISNTNSGNVGIGTTAPSFPLSLGTGIGNKIALWDAGNGQGYGFGIQGGLLQIFSLFNNNRVGIGYGPNSSNFTETLTVRGSNVGIGTISPGYSLDVQGGQVNASGGLCIGGDCKTAWSQVGGGPWSISGSSVYYNSGNVGIGTTAPAAKLHLVSGTDSPNTLLSLDTGLHGGSQFQIGGTTNNESYFNLNVYRAGLYVNRLSVNNFGHLLLQPGGDSNVGIGTSTPTQKLDVQGGKVNASGGLCIAGDCKTAWSEVGGGGAVASVFGRTGAVAAATNDYTWAQINKTTSSLADLTTRSASDLSSGTIPDARFPATLPSASGANLTALNASSLGSGTVATARLGSGTADVSTFLRGDNTWAVPSGGSQWTTSGANINYAPAGNVGIGTDTPTYKLHVTGDGKFTGNLTVDGNIAAKYQDVAEWVPASERISPGTVVVLDSSRSNQVISSTQAYDTRVAGVISEKPGIALGESGANKVLVATTGRVRIKVDATRGPIHIGDLLVTSDTSGMAMKSEPVNLGGVQIHRPGTLIGKALEPLAKGQGEILILLSLQ